MAIFKTGMFLKSWKQIYLISNLKFRYNFFMEKVTCKQTYKLDNQLCSEMQNRT